MVIIRVILSKNNLEPKIKVAVYSRISTKSESQLASLKAQKQYYESLINNNPAWIFVDVYSDIGSGTRTKGRKHFNAMISACRRGTWRGKIDMVLIKSAHRFARNAVDTLETIWMSGIALAIISLLVRPIGAFLKAVRFISLTCNISLSDSRMKITAYLK